MGTNKTALATTQNRLLTDDQLLHAVELFAQGKSRIEVARHFIDTDRNLVEQDQTDPKGLRKRLSNALRVADPNSVQFSVTKYQSHYDRHKVAIIGALKRKYESALMAHIETLEQEIQRLSERTEAVAYKLENAIEDEPTGATEANATETLLFKLKEQQIKTEVRLVEALQQATAEKQDTK